jgi:hypothetical protein
MRKSLVFIFLLIFITGCSIGTEKNVVLPKKVIKNLPKEEPRIIGVDGEKEEALIKGVIEADEKIALIIPSTQIGKYSQESVNTINTYLIFKNENYKLKVYDMVFQTSDNLQKVLNEIREDKINKVVALLTPDFIQSDMVSEHFNDLNVYFPIINKEDTILDDSYKKENLVFGGISYKRQIDALLENKSDKKLIELYDKSNLGKKLHRLTQKYSLSYSKEVNNNNKRYKRFLRSKTFDGGIVILNTPIIKTSILLSQIRALDINIEGAISTQLNLYQ